MSEGLKGPSQKPEGGLRMNCSLFCIRILYLGLLVLLAIVEAVRSKVRLSSPTSPWRERYCKSCSKSRG